MSPLSFHAVHVQKSCFAMIMLLHFVSSLTATPRNKNETDRLTLLAIKEKITDDPQGVVSSWNASSHFCDWEGVICGRQRSRVIIIDVAFGGLAGTLSPYIGNLTFLRGLRLQNNTFHGEIPRELGCLFSLRELRLSNNSFEGEIPATLSRCSELMYLDVGNNNLVGGIPKELSTLSKLTILAIHSNSLTGGISSFIGNLTSLKSLSASNNHFEGSIPDVFGQLRNLREVRLSNNNLSGIIPPSIYNLSALTVLSLGYNQLHGSLQLGIGMMLQHLQILHLQGNLFTGPLPLSVSNLTELESLDVYHNYFTGKITTNFGDLKKIHHVMLVSNNFGSGEPDEMNFFTSMINCSILEILGLRGNQFEGVLPKSVGNLSTKLLALTLGRNFLYGTLPPSLGNLINLGWLSLEENRFTGIIPTSLGNLQKLGKLDLGRNYFSGTIPDSIGNLSFLFELYLGNNRLEGTLPSSLGNCQKLLLLDLSQNNLSGTIPKQIFTLPFLSISLNLSQNHLLGPLPSEVGNLKSLVDLDVSDNNISSDIPSSLSSCTGLVYLHLEGNSFHGSIPASLKSLRGLLTIDLSRNNLSGQIPEFLGQLSLATLNLSYNNFEGEVPIKGVFTNSSTMSVVGNNRICGGISELRLPRCTNKKIKDKMHLVYILIISATSTLVGITLVSCLIFCWLKKKSKAPSTRSSMREGLLQVSYERLLKATGGFSPVNMLGVGSFGSVYKGTLNQEGSIIAVKVLNLQRRGASKSFMAECEVWRNIRHRNLVKIITSCASVDFQGNDFKALVYEFMPNGNLERWLHSSAKSNDRQNELPSLNLLQRINIAIDVASALDYLHNHCQKPIIHCDLKPSNILIDHDMVAHVGDFGLARFHPRITNTIQRSSNGISGTIGYTAPEYGIGSEISTKGDVYSYGICLLEMMTVKRPTDDMFQEGLNLHNFVRMAIPDNVIEIVDQVLLKNNEEETSAAENNTRQNQSIVKKIEECLTSVVKIGVACSVESPQDRMNINDVVHELQFVRYKLSQH
ncbi:unnamed protein product [Ilex paraguariensis]|uniref:non-specific serine/threonine protein kinase n=1 Tax=Ilex paraguariensis TaxID=185542 RepID=A0ABC8QT07_9AQUA